MIIDALGAFNNVETSLACGGDITKTKEELMSKLATAINPTALITICLDPNAELSMTRALAVARIRLCSL